MQIDHTTYYRAYCARDPRFDGVFFLCVKTTGIYCRPVCRARTPKISNVQFFECASAAEKAGFRPCLRCRPELAPGLAPIDDASRIAHRIAQRMQDGMQDTDTETIAAEFELSSRQIRRILQQQLGVSPIELAQTRRLLLAKQLLTETALPMTEIAFASGFASLRRFNDAFAKYYFMPPTRLRKQLAESTAPTTSPTITLQLSYRPPYDWDGMLAFLSTRTLKNVEQIEADCYRRTVQIGAHCGWIAVRHAPKKHALLLELTHSLLPVLPNLLSRVRCLFDLDARPDVISAQLAEDPLLADAVHANPGLRVPGAFDGCELAMRAILGQQVTVKAATTLAGRFTEHFGTAIETPHAGLTQLAPTAARIAQLSVDEIARLGIIQSRARSMIAIAMEVAEGRLRLESGALPAPTIAALTALPGIGAWTAHYIAMRALRWPDAFPKEDIVLRNRLGGISARALEERSQNWRPWRAYATLHLWRMPQPTE